MSALSPEQRAEVEAILHREPGVLLTADQLAARFGVNVETIYRRTQAGDLPHLDMPFGYRYDWNEIHRVFHREGHGGTVTPLAPRKRRRAS